jgi:hypothetical protein
VKHPEENNKKESGCENVHPYWMQVAGSASLYILRRNKPGFNDQVFHGTEKLTIKVGEIGEEMGYEMPDTFFRLEIFLTANVTIPSNHFCPTIQTVLFFPLG